MLVTAVALMWDLVGIQIKKTKQIPYINKLQLQLELHILSLISLRFLDTAGLPT